MSRGQNTIKRSEVSTTPILLKYSASSDSASFTENGITVNRGVNTSFDIDGVQFLNYALVKQLYYQEYITGSALFSSSFWNPSIQSTAASGTFDNDYRYFPTGANAKVTVIGIPRTAFGEQLARKSLLITGSTYRLIDDGNGNVIDSNSSYVHVGNVLYSQGVIIITDEEYQNALIPIPGTTTTTTSTTSTTTTATPTTTTSTTSTTTTGVPTTTTTTTLAPTTTTTTTLAPTTTTTTLAPTTTTTTTLAPTTTTTSTTTTTTTVDCLFTGELLVPRTFRVNNTNSSTAMTVSIEVDSVQQFSATSIGASTVVTLTPDKFFSSQTPSFTIDVPFSGYTPTSADLTIGLTNYTGAISSGIITFNNVDLISPADIASVDITINYAP